MKGNITIVGGAQYGSEGKGVIVAHLANEYGVHIRVGGPNAGHSFMRGGKLWKMQAIPCGWKNKNATLFIGRGGLIHPGLIIKEVDSIKQVDPTIIDRLKIDVKTGVLSEEHKSAEGGTKGEFHLRIGSTGEGVGAAREARISRDPTRFKQVKDVAHEIGGDGWSLDQLMIEDTPGKLNNMYDGGAKICIEGTQGYGLSLIHGPYPYCTSHDTNAAQMAADVGFSPKIIDDVYLVCRSHPIRVWGNSGPMYNEVSWDVISERMGRRIEEKTTVTKKVRRIGEWDEKLFIEAVTINRPTGTAVMFLDYLCPEDEGKDDYYELSADSKNFIKHVERLSKSPALFACTGWSKEKNDWSVIDMRKQLKED